MIQPGIVENVIKTVRPKLVISGDDHDDCVYEHTMYSYPILEHSIGTFSWLQGNIHPSYGVMSFRPLYEQPYLPNSPSFDLDVCSLPPQLFIYFWYIAFTFISILGTVRSLWNTRYKFVSRHELNDPKRFGFTLFALKTVAEMLVIVLSYYLVIILFIWI
jgi:ethanolamine phosphate phosphodiesterase